MAASGFGDGLGRREHLLLGLDGAGPGDHRERIVADADAADLDHGGAPPVTLLALRSMWVASSHRGPVRARSPGNKKPGALAPGGCRLVFYRAMPSRTGAR